MSLPIALMIFLTVSHIQIFGYEEKCSDRDFGIIFEAMGGISYNLKEYSFKSKRLNLSPSQRIMWNPNRRLNIGVEFTYLLFGSTDEDIEDNELGKGKFKAKLEAVPVYLVFNMKIIELDWTAGIGVSYMTSTVETKFNKGSEVTVSYRWQYCFNAGIGYTIDISKNFGLGIESKLFSIANTNEYLASAYLKFVYRIFY